MTSDLHDNDLNLFPDFLKRSGFDGERDRLIVPGDVIDGNGDRGVSLLIDYSMFGSVNFFL